MDRETVREWLEDRPSDREEALCAALLSAWDQAARREAAFRDLEAENFQSLARVRVLEDALRDLVVEENTVSHSHLVPGVWDVSNGPPLGGAKCERCAKFVNARRVLSGEVG